MEEGWGEGYSVFLFFDAWHLHEDVVEERALAGKPVAR
jgi:hypothetical protein